LQFADLERALLDFAYAVLIPVVTESPDWRLCLRACLTTQLNQPSFLPSQMKHGTTVYFKNVLT
jgi:hypothetical protein